MDKKQEAKKRIKLSTPKTKSRPSNPHFMCEVKEVVIQLERLSDSVVAEMTAGGSALLLEHTMEPNDDALNINSFPAEVLINIFSHLSQNELGKIARVCRRWNELTKSPVLWKEKKLEYPCLSQEDLKCLTGKNVLSDTIIEFYLKYIFNEKLTPELQKKTYICSPFFYHKVLNQLTDTDKNRAKSIKRWLKGIDLFSKDFILIPVFADFTPTVKHWYLVIICFLSKIEKTPVYGDDSGTTTCNAGTQSMLQLKSSNSEVTVKRPCFCFFDSARPEKELGIGKLRVFKNLKNFLKKLWLSTNCSETCDWSQFISFNVECPQQNNWYDSGNFLLQFAESFFKTPITKFEDPINVTHWFDQSMITENRKEIKKIIVERMQ